MARRLHLNLFGSTSDLRDIGRQIEAVPLDAVNQVHPRLRAKDVRFRAVLTP